MKQIFTIIFCMFFHTVLTAQNNGFKAFEQYCIDVAANTNNIPALERSIKGYDGKNFVYAKTSVSIMPLTVCESFAKTDSTCETDYKGHFMFLPEYVDDWIMRHEIAQINRATILRDDNVIDLYYYVSVLKPRGIVKYTISSTGDVAMFAVGENCSPLKLTAECQVKKDRDSEIEECEFSDTATSRKPSAQISWNMYNRSQIVITIENMTDNEASFIFALHL